MVAESKDIDFTSPHQFYPDARAMKRHFIIHRGPTNSGKTYHAVQKLKESNAGLFCSPLRLLASEQQEKLANEGYLANLLTGQEKVEVEGAKHLSCTVEMAPLHKRWDVCVVDECQLIGSSRGAAWTNVLLGVQADKVICCEDGTATSVIEFLCSVTNDTFEVKDFQRQTSLAVEEEPVHGLRQLQRGDCVVSFARNKLHSMRNLIETNTNHKVHVS